MTDQNEKVGMMKRTWYDLESDGITVFEDVDENGAEIIVIADANEKQSLPNTKENLDLFLERARNLIVEWTNEKFLNSFNQ